jgi:hypothetical protein
MRWGGSYSSRSHHFICPTRYSLRSLGPHRGIIAGRDLYQVMYPRPLRLIC